MLLRTVTINSMTSSNNRLIGRDEKVREICYYKKPNVMGSRSKGVVYFNFNLDAWGRPGCFAVNAFAIVGSGPSRKVKKVPKENF